MTMHLLIKTDNVELQEKYNGHTNYHPGDSGLDLFCPKDILVKSGETVKIDLEIQQKQFQRERRLKTKLRVKLLSILGLLSNTIVPFYSSFKYN